MKILYVAMKYDYGQRERGLSFEHFNFFDSLHRMGHDVVYFDFMSLIADRGKDGMNKLLVDVARAEHADVMFSCLFTDQFDTRAIRRISKRMDTVTVNWFTDDHWRFETFSRRWAPSFNWVVTTASSALPRYAALGYQNVIKSQWACNHFLYRKLDLQPLYDVTFVGQPHGDRVATIEHLRSAGIDVKRWGHRWEAGRLTQEEMIAVFNQSRINLNLSNAYRSPELPPSPRQRISSALQRHPAGRAAKRSIRRIVDASRAAPPASPPSGNDAGGDAPILPDQIKGRNFEVPGCGGFLLTGYADDLERYYEPGAEIACFESRARLVEQIAHYLDHEDERTRIAERGYERTLREHTYAHRFREIFGRMGFQDEDLGAAGPGDILEVT